MIRDLGLNRIPYESESRFLSDNPKQPTAFSYHGRAVFPEGRVLFDVTSNKYVTLESDVVCEIESNVLAHVCGNRIFGKIDNASKYLTLNNFRLEFAGDIEMQVF